MKGSRFALLACSLLSVLPNDAGAQTYSVQVNSELNGLDITIESVPSPTMLVIRMRNKSEQRVRCDLVFDASPQTPVRSRRMINPGQSTESVLHARRRWFSVTVNVTCQDAARQV
jgi:hypothetical protein